MKFDSIDQIQTCFRSDEYRHLTPLRERSTVSRSIIVEGSTVCELE
ncbi:DUF1330 domain-containing protein [Desulforhabdus amnigena]|nr:DUF1330 domain-containing protein [Deltaproteobacteria bacterium]